MFLYKKRCITISGHNLFSLKRHFKTPPISVMNVSYFECFFFILSVSIIKCAPKLHEGYHLQIFITSRIW